jgi:hypothetical protein
MAKAVVQIAPLVTIQTTTIHRALLVWRDNTVIKCFKHPTRLAKHVLRAPIRPPKVSQVWKIATNARLEKKTQTMALLRAVIVQSVLTIQNRWMKDPQHAFLVVLVKQQTREVPNATEPHATRAPLKTLTPEHVQSAHKVGHRKSWMPQCAHTAHSAPPLCPILLGILRVLGVILVHLVVGKAFAKIARPGFIKIQKANRNALNVKQDCFTPVLKHNAVAVI